MRQLLTWCGTRALGEKAAAKADEYHAGFAGIYVLYIQRCGHIGNNPA